MVVGPGVGAGVGNLVGAGEGGEGEAGGDQLALEDKSEKTSDR